MLRLFTAMAAICLGFYLITSNQPKKNSVVIFGSKAGVQAQLDEWKPAAADLDKRDVTVFRSSEIPNSSEVEKQLSIEPGAFAIVIFGKDGHTARRSTQPISAQTLCTLVDTMPAHPLDRLSDR